MFGFRDSEMVLAILLGIVSHLLVFIHGELDRYAAIIVAVFSVAFASLVAWASMQERSLLGGLILATTLFGLYQLSLGTSIVTYRLMFHRARHFEGHVIYSVSKWFAAWKAASTGQFHLELMAQHRDCGDFVRIGPMEISINNSDAVQALHGPQSPCVKGPFYDLGGVGQNLHRTRDPVLHDRQRPFWNKAFTPDNLEYAADSIGECATKLISTISAFNCDTVNITPLLDEAAFEMMSQSAFSRQFDLDGPDQTAAALESLHQSQALLGSYGHVPWVYAIAKYFGDLLPSNDRFTDLADRLVQYRRVHEPKFPDLFSFLFQTEHNPEAAGFPLEWEARLAMVAGSANTSTTMTAACFYLATHPSSLSALYEEVFPLLSTRTFNMRKPLPILDSIIYESMRLQPAMPSGVERMTPPQGLCIGRYFVPGNIICRVPSFVLLRDERYFVQPHAFKPERWTTQKELVLDKSVFTPFGQGKYGCVGSRLGMMKIRTVLAYLVINFNFKLADKVDRDRWELSGREHFLMVLGRLNLIFEKRS